MVILRTYHGHIWGDHNPGLPGLLFVVVRIIWSRHPSSLTQSSSLEYIRNTRELYWLFYWLSTANRSYTTSLSKRVRTERHVTEVVVTIVEHHWIRPASVSCDHDLFMTTFPVEYSMLHIPVLYLWHWYWRLEYKSLSPCDYHEISSTE
jgi:hypothetical protein